MIGSLLWKINFWNTMTHFMLTFRFFHCSDVPSGLSYVPISFSLKELIQLLAKILLQMYVCYLTLNLPYLFYIIHLMSSRIGFSLHIYFFFMCSTVIKFKRSILTGILKHSYFSKVFDCLSFFYECVERLQCTSFLVELPSN